MMNKKIIIAIMVVCLVVLSSVSVFPNSNTTTTHGGGLPPLIGNLSTGTGTGSSGTDGLDSVSGSTSSALKANQRELATRLKHLRSSKIDSEYRNKNSNELVKFLKISVNKKNYGVTEDQFGTYYTTTTGERKYITAKKYPGVNKGDYGLVITGSPTANFEFIDKRGDKYELKNTFLSGTVIKKWDPEKKKYVKLETKNKGFEEFVEQRKTAIEKAEKEDWQAARDCSGESTSITNCGIFHDAKYVAEYADGFDGYSYIFMDDEARQEWTQGVDKFFEPFEPAGWANAICQNKIDTPPKGTAYVELPQGQGIAVAATIAAECTVQRDPFNGTNEYIYKIVGFVKNPSGTYSESSVDFNINLQGPGKNIDLFTEDQSLERGARKSLQGRNAFVQQTENLYEQVCVNFKSPPEFYPSDTICNSITCHNTTSSTFIGREYIIPDPVDETDPETEVEGSTGGTGTEYNRI